MSAKTTLDVDTPPLRDGDRLTAGEFHRRYEAMPNVKQVNLVNGVVHMASPIRLERHGGPQGAVQTWFGQYLVRLPGVRMYGPSTFRVDEANEVEPDVMLILAPEYGGRSWADDDDYLRGVPELVVEIAASSARLDAGEKRDLYERIGVQEYVLWRVNDDEIDWWANTAAGFESLPADEAGVIRSRVFPGLWLDPAALVARDGNRLADVVDLGKASLEYAAFFDHLRRLAAGEDS